MHDLLTSIIGPYLLGFLVSAGIGLIIGLEREFDAAMGNEHFAGLRTFILTSLLGYIITYISKTYLETILLITIPGLFILITIFHYVKGRKNNLGFATELSLLIVFFLGVFVGLHYMREAMASAVIVTIVLSLRPQFKLLMAQITQEELYAFIKFIFLSLLVLPFLPDQKLGPNGIINPQSVGLVIVITSMLSFGGYFLMKFAGAKRGILLTGLMGGTFSSTAITWIFSSKSRETPTLSPIYAAGIIMASSVMYLRVLVITYLFNPSIFKVLLIPCIVMTLVGLGWVYIIHSKYNHQALTPALQLGNPMDIKNALLFGMLFMGITLLVFYADKYFGTKGLYFSGILSGVSDVDAISISMANYSKSNNRTNLAAIVIVLAILSNTVVKTIVGVIKSTPQARKWIIWGLGSMIISGAFNVLALYTKIH